MSVTDSDENISIKGNGGWFMATHKGRVDAIQVCWCWCECHPDIKSIGLSASEAMDKWIENMNWHGFHEVTVEKRSGSVSA